MLRLIQSARDSYLSRHLARAASIAGPLLIVLMLFALLFVAVSALFAAPAVAQEKAQDEEQTVTTYEVERQKVDELDKPSLRFLRDHKTFLRAQLDKLRLKTTQVRDGDAELLDARWLRMQEMAAAIAAARDTVRDERTLTEERALLASVTGLGDLESRLDLMESLLDEQSARLTWLEADFLGHQETALVVLLRGGGGSDSAGVPSGVVMNDGNAHVTVRLNAAQRLALAQGGVAQIYHELVEPREHVLEVVFTDAAGDTASTATVPFDAERDRLTFLELDLGNDNDESDAAAPVVSIWQR